VIPVESDAPSSQYPFPACELPCVTSPVPLPSPVFAWKFSASDWQAALSA
jgi:hypothetical protein